MEKHCFRITPAGAGKTAAHGPDPARDEDHPRRCGENRLCDRLSGAPGGSPPQVRGKLALYSRVATIGRITPAGAGKTYQRQDMKTTA